MIARRIAEVFWQGLPAYFMMAVFLLSVGWWLLGLAITRYGIADAASEIAHHVLGLGFGQASAVAYAAARCAPPAWLDYMRRRHNGEWDALAALDINGPAYVCTPWLLASTLAATGFWALYYALYLCVEQVYPVVASWAGVAFVSIPSGIYASLSTLAFSMPCVAVGGFTVAWVALLLAIRMHAISSSTHAQLVRGSGVVLRVYLIALGSAGCVLLLLYAIFQL